MANSLSYGTPVVRPIAVVLPVSFAEDFRKAILVSPLFIASSNLAAPAQALFTKECRTNIILDQIDWLLDLLVGTYHTKPIVLSGSDGYSVDTGFDDYVELLRLSLPRTLVNVELIFNIITELSVIVYNGFQNLDYPPNMYMVKWVSPISGIFAPIPPPAPVTPLLEYTPGQAYGTLDTFI